jgi:hypothetical protein
MMARVIWYLKRIVTYILLNKLSTTKVSKQSAAGLSLKFFREETGLLAASHPSLIIIRESRSINNLDTLAKTDHIGALPPLGDRVLSRLALAPVVLVVSVDKTAEASSIAANNDDGLADPALDILDVVAACAAEGVDDVDEVGADVAQHVDKAAWLAEGHDHGWVLDQTESLCVEGVPEYVVGAASRQGWGVDGVLLGLRVD